MGLFIIKQNFGHARTLVLRMCFMLFWLYPYQTFAFQAEYALFNAKINTFTINYKTAFITVLPEEEIKIELQEGDESAYTLTFGNKIIPIKSKPIKLKAPAKPGDYKLLLKRSSDSAALTVTIFVMYPSSAIKNGALNGYKIGTYPSPLKGLNAYKAPRGYIEVTKENKDISISPHFTLGEFICKQAGGYPKYIALRPLLLDKLELLLEEVNKRGVLTDNFVVMSGYRTPFYNKAIGNVANSRHIYGGAADIYIDVYPADGVMDDINRDNKLDENDAAYLYEIADALIKRTGRQDLIGGLGQYQKNSAHGPFVHIDVRGSRARWGH